MSFTLTRLLKLGVTKGKDVEVIQDMLNRAHFPAGVVDGIFGPVTEAAVEAFQSHYGLDRDGIVGPATFTMLQALLNVSTNLITDDVVDTFHEVVALSSSLPKTRLDWRMSGAIALQQTCDDGQGMRYGGWINPYQYDSPDYDQNQVVVLPEVGRIVKGTTIHKPVHGGTCSPWGGLMTVGWWFCGNQDYNFRIGRNARYISQYSCQGKTPGLKEYTEVEGVLRLEHHPLNDLYKHWEWLNQFNMVEMDHHVIMILKVGGDDGFNLENPLQPGEPMPAGLYRWAADGFYPRREVNGEMQKFYSGTKQTFRRIAETERCSQGWDVFRFQNLDPDDCCPTTGPWKGRKPWDLVLED